MNLSTNDPEFSTPVLDVLTSGKSVALWLSFSRCGGLSRQFLVQSPEAYHTVLRQFAKSDTRVIANLCPRVIARGQPSASLLTAAWLHYEAQPSALRSAVIGRRVTDNLWEYRFPDDGLMEMLIEMREEDVVLLDDDYEDWLLTGYVPRPDGSVVPGAY